MAILTKFKTKISKIEEHYISYFFKKTTVHRTQTEKTDSTEIYKSASERHHIKLTVYTILSEKPKTVDFVHYSFILYAGISQTLRVPITNNKKLQS